MARDTQRKTTRARVAAPQLRDPRIEERTRFINATGGRSNEGVANALKSAFGVGEKFLNERTVRENEEGDQRALADKAFARGEDTDDQNLGYQRGWSRLRAENDFNAAEGEYKEFLRGADLENMEEVELQESYNTFMQDKFGGAEQDPEYAAYIAPRLVELELETIAEHRDMVVQGIQTEQSVMITENLLSRFDSTGEFDYKYLADETNRVFDGPDKNVAYSEKLFDFAIDNGLPSLITNMPDTFPTGQPTIKNIDDFQDLIRAAEREATTVAIKKQAAESAAMKQKNDDDMFDTQLTIAVKTIGGESVAEEINILRANPEASFATLTSAINFGQAQLDEGDSRSADLPMEATTWQGIYTGNINVEDIMQLYADGTFGTGAQAVTTVQKMLSTVQSQRAMSQRGDSSTVSVYRAELTKTYNPQLQGPLGPLDPVLMNIQNEAVSEYNRRVHEAGEAPRVARDAVRAQFDAAVDRIAPDALSDAGKTSQSTNARVRGLTITAGDAKRFANGDLSPEAFIGPRSIEELVLQLEAISDSLSQEELEAISKQFLAQ